MALLLPLFFLLLAASCANAEQALSAAPEAHKLAIPAAPLSPALPVKPYTPPALLPAPPPKPYTPPPQAPVYSPPPKAATPPVVKPPYPPKSPSPPVSVPPPVAPYPPKGPVSPPVSPPAPVPYYGPGPPVKKEDCVPLCGKRCSLHSRKRLCVRACSTCCFRCKCVPPGTYGNKEVCGRCYTDMTTHGGRPKCP